METVRYENKFLSLLKFGRLGNGTASQAFVLWTAVLIWNHYILSGAMVIIMFAVVWTKKEFRDAVLAEKTFLLLNAAVSSVSMLSSVISGNFIGMAISMGVFFLLSIFSCLKGIMTKESFEKFTVFVCLGSVVAFICALVQKLLIYRNAMYRPTAGAFNANYYGTLIAMTAVLSAVKLFENGGADGTPPWYRKTKAFYAAVLTVNCAALLLSESRSSLLALMVCAGLYLLLSKRFLLCSVFAVFGAGVWVVGWFYPDIFSWTNSLSFVFTERMEIWGCALRSFVGSVRSILIGRGPMTYYMVWESEGLFGANHAHNLLIDSLLNVGVIGTLLYLAVIVMMFGSALSARSKGNINAVILTVLFIAEITVQGIADVTIMWHQSATFFLAVAAFCGVKPEVGNKA